MTMPRRLEPFVGLLLLTVLGCGAHTQLSEEGDADLDGDMDDGGESVPSVTFVLRYISNMDDQICIFGAPPGMVEWLEIETVDDDSPEGVQFFLPFCDCFCDACGDCRETCPDIADPQPGTLVSGATFEFVWEAGLILGSRDSCPGDLSCWNHSTARPGRYLARACYSPGGPAGTPASECWAVSARYCEQVIFRYPEDSVVEILVEGGD